eukprot:Rhum_TRINITY_DN15193_c2_g1::Rhum_TRINITY_DN15193_c2_g1_i1::g.143073::m.143073
MVFRLEVGVLLALLTLLHLLQHVLRAVLHLEAVVLLRLGRGLEGVVLLARHVHQHGHGADAEQQQDPEDDHECGGQAQLADVQALAAHAVAVRVRGTHHGAALRARRREHLQLVAGGTLVRVRLHNDPLVLALLPAHLDVHRVLVAPRHRALHQQLHLRRLLNRCVRVLHGRAAALLHQQDVLLASGDALGRNLQAAVRGRRDNLDVVGGVAVHVAAVDDVRERLALRRHQRVSRDEARLRRVAHRVLAEGAGPARGADARAAVAGAAEVADLLRAHQALPGRHARRVADAGGREEATVAEAAREARLADAAAVNAVAVLARLRAALRGALALAPQAARVGVARRLDGQRVANELGPRLALGAHPLTVVARHVVLAHRLVRVEPALVAVLADRALPLALGVLVAVRLAVRGALQHEVALLLLAPLTLGQLVAAVLVVLQGAAQAGDARLLVRPLADRLRLARLLVVRATLDVAARHLREVEPLAGRVSHARRRRGVRRAADADTLLVRDARGHLLLDPRARVVRSAQRVAGVLRAADDLVTVAVVPLAVLDATALLGVALVDGVRGVTLEARAHKLGDAVVGLPLADLVGLAHSLLRVSAARLVNADTRLWHPHARSLAVALLLSALQRAAALLLALASSRVPDTRVVVVALGREAVHAAPPLVLAHLGDQVPLALVVHRARVVGLVVVAAHSRLAQVAHLTGRLRLCVPPALTVGRALVARRVLAHVPAAAQQALVPAAVLVRRGGKAEVHLAVRRALARDARRRRRVPGTGRVQHAVALDGPLAARLVHRLSVADHVVSDEGVLAAQAEQNVVVQVVQRHRHEVAHHGLRQNRAQRVSNRLVGRSDGLVPPQRHAEDLDVLRVEFGAGVGQSRRVVDGARRDDEQHLLPVVRRVAKGDVGHLHSRGQVVVGGAHLVGRVVLPLVVHGREVSRQLAVHAAVCAVVLRELDARDAHARRRLRQVARQRQRLRPVVQHLHQAEVAHRVAAKLPVHERRAVEQHDKVKRAAVLVQRRVALREVGVPRASGHLRARATLRPPDAELVAVRARSTAVLPHAAGRHRRGGLAHHLALAPLRALLRSAAGRRVLRVPVARGVLVARVLRQVRNALVRPGALVVLPLALLVLHALRLAGVHARLLVARARQSVPRALRNGVARLLRLEVAGVDGAPLRALHLVVPQAAVHVVPARVLRRAAARRHAADVALVVPVAVASRLALVLRGEVALSELHAVVVLPLARLLVVVDARRLRAERRAHRSTALKRLVDPLAVVAVARRNVAVERARQRRLLHRLSAELIRRSVHDGLAEQAVRVAERLEHILLQAVQRQVQHVLVQRAGHNLLHARRRLHVRKRHDVEATQHNRQRHHVLRLQQRTGLRQLARVLHLAVRDHQEHLALASNRALKEAARHQHRVHDVVVRVHVVVLLPVQVRRQLRLRASQPSARANTHRRHPRAALAGELDERHAHTLRRRRVGAGGGARQRQGLDPPAQALNHGQVAVRVVAERARHRLGPVEQHHKVHRWAAAVLVVRALARSGTRVPEALLALRARTALQLLAHDVRAQRRVGVPHAADLVGSARLLVGVRAAALLLAARLPRALLVVHALLLVHVAHARLRRARLVVLVQAARVLQTLHPVHVRGTRLLHTRRPRLVAALQRLVPLAARGLDAVRSGADPARTRQTLVVVGPDAALDTTQASVAAEVLALLLQADADTRAVRRAHLLPLATRVARARHGVVVVAERLLEAQVVLPHAQARLVSKALVLGAVREAARVRAHLQTVVPLARAVLVADLLARVHEARLHRRHRAAARGLNQLLAEHRVRVAQALQHLLLHLVQHHVLEVRLVVLAHQLRQRALGLQVLLGVRDVPAHHNTEHDHAHALQVALTREGSTRQVDRRVEHNDEHLLPAVRRGAGQDADRLRQRRRNVHNVRLQAELLVPVDVRADLRGVAGQAAARADAVRRLAGASRELHEGHTHAVRRHVSRRSDRARQRQLRRPVLQHREQSVVAVLVAAERLRHRVRRAERNNHVHHGAATEAGRRAAEHARANRGRVPEAATLVLALARVAGGKQLAVLVHALVVLPHAARLRVSRALRLLGVPRAELQSAECRRLRDVPLALLVVRARGLVGVLRTLLQLARVGRRPLAVRALLALRLVLHARRALQLPAAGALCPPAVRVGSARRLVSEHALLLPADRIVRAPDATRLVQHAARLGVVSTLANAAVRLRLVPRAVRQRNALSLSRRIAHVLLVARTVRRVEHALVLLVGNAGLGVTAVQQARVAHARVHGLAPEAARVVATLRRRRVALTRHGGRHLARGKDEPAPVRGRLAEALQKVVHLLHGDGLNVGLRRGRQHWLQSLLVQHVARALRRRLAQHHTEHLHVGDLEVRQHLARRGRVRVQVVAEQDEHLLAAERGVLEEVRRTLQTRLDRHRLRRVHLVVQEVRNVSEQLLPVARQQTARHLRRRVRGRAGHVVVERRRPELQKRQAHSELRHVLRVVALSRQREPLHQGAQLSDQRQVAVGVAAEQARHRLRSREGDRHVRASARAELRANTRVLVGGPEARGVSPAAAVVVLRRVHRALTLHALVAEHSALRVRRARRELVLPAAAVRGLAERRRAARVPLAVEVLHARDLAHKVHAAARRALRVRLAPLAALVGLAHELVDVLAHFHGAHARGLPDTARLSSAVRLRRAQALLLGTFVFGRVPLASRLVRDARRLRAVVAHHRTAVGVLVVPLALGVRDAGDLVAVRAHLLLVAQHRRVGVPPAQLRLRLGQARLLRAERQALAAAALDGVVVPHARALLVAVLRAVEVVARQLLLRRVRDEVLAPLLRRRAHPVEQLLLQRAQAHVHDVVGDGRERRLRVQVHGRVRLQGADDHTEDVRLRVLGALQRVLQDVLLVEDGGVRDHDDDALAAVVSGVRRQHAGGLDQRVREVRVLLREVLLVPQNVTHKLRVEARDAAARGRLRRTVGQRRVRRLHLAGHNKPRVTTELDETHASHAPHGGVGRRTGLRLRHREHAEPVLQHLRHRVEAARVAAELARHRLGTREEHHDVHRRARAVVAVHAVSVVPEAAHVRVAVALLQALLALLRVVVVLAVHLTALLEVPEALGVQVALALLAELAAVLLLAETRVDRAVPHTANVLDADVLGDGRDAGLQVTLRRRGVPVAVRLLLNAAVLRAARLATLLDALVRVHVPLALRQRVAGTRDRLLARVHRARLLHGVEDAVRRVAQAAVHRVVHALLRRARHAGRRAHPLARLVGVARVLRRPLAHLPLVADLHLATLPLARGVTAARRRVAVVEARRVTARQVGLVPLAALVEDARVLRRVQAARLVRAARGVRVAGHDETSPLARRVADARKHLRRHVVDLHVRKVVLVGGRDDGQQVGLGLLRRLAVRLSATHDETQNHNLLVVQGNPRRRQTRRVKDGTVREDDQQLLASVDRRVREHLHRHLQRLLQVRLLAHEVVLVPLQVANHLRQRTREAAARSDSRRHLLRRAGHTAVRSLVATLTTELHDTQTDLAVRDRVRANRRVLAAERQLLHPVNEHRCHRVETVGVAAERVRHRARAVDHHHNVQRRAPTVLLSLADTNVVRHGPEAGRVRLALARLADLVARLLSADRGQRRLVPVAVRAQAAVRLRLVARALRLLAAARRRAHVPLAERVARAVQLRVVEHTLVLLALLGGRVPRAARVGLALVSHAGLADDLPASTRQGVPLARLVRRALVERQRDALLLAARVLSLHPLAVRHRVRQARVLVRVLAQALPAGRHPRRVPGALSLEVGLAVSLRVVVADLLLVAHRRLGVPRRAVVGRVGKARRLVAVLSARGVDAQERDVVPVAASVVVAAGLLRVHATRLVVAAALLQGQHRAPSRLRVAQLRQRSVLRHKLVHVNVREVRGVRLRRDRVQRLLRVRVSRGRRRRPAHHDTEHLRLRRLQSTLRRRQQRNVLQLAVCDDHDRTLPAVHRRRAEDAHSHVERLRDVRGTSQEVVLVPLKVALQLSQVTTQPSAGADAAGRLEGRVHRSSFAAELHKGDTHSARGGLGGRAHVRLLAVEREGRNPVNQRRRQGVETVRVTAERLRHRERTVNHNHQVEGRARSELPADTLAHNRGGVLVDQPEAVLVLLAQARLLALRLLVVDLATLLHARVLAGHRHALRVGVTAVSIALPADNRARAVPAAVRLVTDTRRDRSVPLAVRVTVALQLTVVLRALLLHALRRLVKSRPLAVRVLVTRRLAVVQAALQRALRGRRVPRAVARRVVRALVQRDPVALLRATGALQVVPHARVGVSQASLLVVVDTLLAAARARLHIKLAGVVLLALVLRAVHAHLLLRALPSGGVPGAEVVNIGRAVRLHAVTQARRVLARQHSVRVHARGVLVAEVLREVSVARHILRRTHNELAPALVRVAQVVKHSLDRRHSRQPVDLHVDDVVRGRRDLLQGDGRGGVHRALGVERTHGGTEDGDLQPVQRALRGRVLVAVIQDTVGDDDKHLLPVHGRVAEEADRALQSAEQVGLRLVLRVAHEVLLVVREHRRELLERAREPRARRRRVVLVHVVRRVPAVASELHHRDTRLARVRHRRSARLVARQRQVRNPVAQQSRQRVETVGVTSELLLHRDTAVEGNHNVHRRALAVLHLGAVRASLGTVPVARRVLLAVALVERVAVPRHAVRRSALHESAPLALAHVLARVVLLALLLRAHARRLRHVPEAVGLALTAQLVRELRARQRLAVNHRAEGTGTVPRALRVAQALGLGRLQAVLHAAHAAVGRARVVPLAQVGLGAALGLGGVRAGALRARLRGNVPVALDRIGDARVLALVLAPLLHALVVLHHALRVLRARRDVVLAHELLVAARVRVAPLAQVLRVGVARRGLAVADARRVDARAEHVRPDTARVVATGHSVLVRAARLELSGNRLVARHDHLTELRRRVAQTVHHAHKVVQLDVHEVVVLAERAQRLQRRLSVLVHGRGRGEPAQHDAELLDVRRREALLRVRQVLLLSRRRHVLHGAVRDHDQHLQPLLHGRREHVCGGVQRVREVDVRADVVLLLPRKVRLQLRTAAREAALRAHRRRRPARAHHHAAGQLELVAARELHESDTRAARGRVGVRCLARKLAVQGQELHPVLQHLDHADVAVGVAAHLPADRLRTNEGDHQVHRRARSVLHGVALAVLRPEAVGVRVALARVERRAVLLHTLLRVVREHALAVGLARQHVRLVPAAVLLVTDTRRDRSVPLAVRVTVALQLTVVLRALLLRARLANPLAVRVGVTRRRTVVQAALQ